MTIQQAIEKAVAGGYDYNSEIPPFHDALCQMMLDPAFWSALGKTEGWNKTDWDIDYWTWGGKQERVNEPKLDEPTFYMHRLIDHLADGGTIEGYFETL